MKKLLLSLLIAATTPAIAQMDAPFFGPVVGSSGVLSLFPGWTYLQDTISGQNQGGGTGACGSGSASCTMTVFPTTAGSLWVVSVSTGNQVTITTTGGWSLCPSSNCNVYNSSTGDNVDVAYRTGGAANTTSITVTTTPANSGGMSVEFVELLPPAGYTVSYDTSGTTNHTGNCLTCTATALTLAGTDAVLHFQGGGESDEDAGQWNAWSSPYIMSNANFYTGIGLNVSSGAAPTFTQYASGPYLDSVIAFKTTAGTFTTPAPFTILHQTVAGPFHNSGPPTNVSCTPACPAITVPSTGSGNLLFMAFAATTSGVYLSSISGGGTWVTPASCQISATGLAQAQSCAYVLSSTGSVTSITPTLTGSASASYIVYEVSRSSGTWTLDTIGKTQQTCTVGNCAGQALTLNGSTPDIVFQGIYITNQTNANSLYPITQPYHFWGSAYAADGASAVVLPNTENGTAPLWGSTYSGHAGVWGAAFK